jgi:hypothetical protein
MLLTLGSSKMFYSAEALAPFKWGDFEPSLRINHISEKAVNYLIFVKIAQLSEVIHQI